MKRIFLLLSTLGIYSSVAMAQSESPVRVMYREVTELDLTGFEVQAVVDRPDGTLVVAPPRPTFAPMIVVRMNFDVEMSASLDEVP